MPPRAICARSQARVWKPGASTSATCGWLRLVVCQRDDEGEQDAIEAHGDCARDRSASRKTLYASRVTYDVRARGRRAGRRSRRAWARWRPWPARLVQCRRGGELQVANYHEHEILAVVALNYGI